MRKGPIEIAIEEFRNKTLNVYKADHERIVRDARAADRAAKDHNGRWLFELLQNCDDAKATEVKVLVEDDTIYVADNGHGLEPKAVSALCGTDFSDKTTGTIGRKGVGFKSVYELSQNPQVITVGEGGVEFSPEKTKKWLRENALNSDHVPYQWVPFFIRWEDALAEDPQLGTLTAYKTIVKLPGLSPGNKQKSEQLLREWPPNSLLTFRHLRQIKAPSLEIALSGGDGIWYLRDSRGQTPEQWRGTKLIEHPPDKLLEAFREFERQAISKDGVGFLIAAPVVNDCVVPTKDYLPVHVFYPTEQKGPIRLLLHAEFLVKSDRTALMPVDANPFNAWIADRLACHICNFVNDAYHIESPSSHAALLVPFGDRASHPVANDLWQCIVDKASSDLRLADLEGQQRLRVGEARLISVSVRRDLARTLLDPTNIRKQLLHAMFDIDKHARKALRELGCSEIDDQGLMHAIVDNAHSLASDTQWVWACWEWLATWVAENPYGDEHRKRIERVKALPVVPINGSLVKASDFAGRIVTWKPETDVGSLPDWLPLIFVDDWFSDRLKNENAKDSPVKKLSKELDIKEPSDDIVQKALGQAIEQYCKNKQGDPGRFLRFILEQDWYETAYPSPSLRRCPVPLSQPVNGETWAEAQKTYFGREWGNNLLADLYEDCAGVAWVADNNPAGDKEKLYRVLDWLGVADAPRIIEEHHKSSVWELPENCGEWKKYLETARDYCGRSVERIEFVSRIDHLLVENLDPSHGALLIRLIARYWEAYYHNCAEVVAEGRSSRERYNRLWHVKAKWWWEVCEILSLPTRSHCTINYPLTELWLPDKQTERAMGELLYVVDLDAFGDDKDVVGHWLINTVGLRSRIEQLTVKEWEKLLSTSIPQTAPAERVVQEDRLRDKVTHWYTALLDTASDQENVSESTFALCPLLCRKGNMWQYVTKEPRYLDDDNDLSTTFAKDVWLFHIPTRLADAAAKYFGVQTLSQSVEVNVTPGESKSPLSDGMLAQFNASLPYVWAWRSSQSKEAAESLVERLKNLEVLVVTALRTSLSLDGVHKEVERRWHIDDDTIYLHKDHENVTELAQALAKALNVRSEADFYENLLRCSGDLQRKEKLLSKGMVGDEIERCLREYAGPSSVEVPEEQPTEKEPVAPITGTRPPLVPTGTVKDPSVAQPTPEPHGKEPDEPQPQPDTVVRPPLRIKNPDTAEYVLGTPPEVGGGHAGGGGVGGMGQEERSLTDTDKNKAQQLGEAGETIAARQLEKMGFSVEKMPPDNPGFDIRAIKDGDELRVEVKAHSRRATVVEVTQREYKEYLGQHGYRWELWNVEHLADGDPNLVVITRYDQIPDDALDTRTFRVDLKKCQSCKIR